MRKHFLGLVILSLMVLSISYQAYSSDEGKPSTFVDIDGDGFNDNLSDYDGDGIPDEADPDYKAEVNSSLGGYMNFGEAFASSDYIDELTPNSAKFGKRSFLARSLSKDRCGYDADSDFGPGSGIGIGAVSGGQVCEGGVCH